MSGHEVTMFTLDPELPWAEARVLVQERLDRIAENECECDEDAHNNALHDLASDDVPELMRRLDEREAYQNTIATIRAIHRPRQCGCSDPGCTAHTLADCCYGEEWPCPTIRALDA